MSKKDYIKFAKMINERLETCKDKHYPASERLIAKMTIESLAVEIADIFSDDSPNFNRSRFMAACGISV